MRVQLHSSTTSSTRRNTGDSSSSSPSSSSAPAPSSATATATAAASTPPTPRASNASTTTIRSNDNPSSSSSAAAMDSSSPPSSKRGLIVFSPSSIIKSSSSLLLFDSNNDGKEEEEEEVGCTISALNRSIIIGRIILITSLVFFSILFGTMNYYFFKRLIAESDYLTLTTNAPLYSSIAVVIGMVITMIAFFLYDALVTKELQSRKEALQARKQFMRYVSHEVRSPLNAVSMGLDLIQSEMAYDLGYDSVASLQANFDVIDDDNSEKQQEQKEEKEETRCDTTTATTNAASSNNRSLLPCSGGLTVLGTRPRMIDDERRRQEQQEEQRVAASSGGTATNSSTKRRRYGSGHDNENEEFIIDTRSSTTDDNTEQDQTQRYRKKAKNWFRLTQEIQNNAQGAVEVMDDLLNYHKIECGNLQLNTNVIPDVWTFLERTVHEECLSQNNAILKEQASLSSSSNTKSAAPYKLNLSFEQEQEGRGAVSNIVMNQSKDIPSKIRSLKVIGDIERLTYVIQNLVSNALASSDDGSVDIKILFLASSSSQQQTKTNSSTTIGTDKDGRNSSITSCNNNDSITLQNDEVVSGSIVGRIKVIISDSTACTTGLFATGTGTTAATSSSSSSDQKQAPPPPPPSIHHHAVANNNDSNNVLMHNTVEGSPSALSLYIAKGIIEHQNHNGSFTVTSSSSSSSSSGGKENNGIQGLGEKGTITTFEINLPLWKISSSDSDSDNDNDNDDNEKASSSSVTTATTTAAAAAAAAAAASDVNDKDDNGSNAIIKDDVPIVRRSSELWQSSSPSRKRTNLEISSSSSSPPTSDNKKGPSSSSKEKEESGGGVESSSVLPPAKMKILVVDDVLSNRKLLKRLVERSGHYCDVAENGKQCVEMAVSAATTDNDNNDKDQRYRPYDSILLDFEMPIMDGPTAAKEIRNRYRLTKVNIIGITGNVLPDDIKFFKSCGANDVLAKPVKMPTIQSSWMEYFSSLSCSSCSHKRRKTM